MLFLSETAWRNEIISTVKDFTSKVLYIQQRYRMKKKSLENRLDFLSEYFERERHWLVLHFSSRKTKKAKTHLKKLATIEEKVKLQLLRLYLKKQFHEYCCRFQAWRSLNYGSPLKSDRRQEIASEIEGLLTKKTDTMLEELPKFVTSKEKSEEPKSLKQQFFN